MGQILNRFRRLGRKLTGPSNPFAGSYVPSKPQVPPPPPYVPISNPTSSSSGTIGISGTWNPSGIPLFATGMCQSGYLPWATARGIGATILPSQDFELDVPEVNIFDQRIPQSMLSQFTVNGKNVQLKQSDYKASGGEGVVYVKNGNAYKVYHDPKKMIPIGKIQELSVLKEPNILGPQDIIYVGNVPHGFVMRYVSNTEFLCKLFTKGFRDKNGITPDTINGLVKNMQDTLKRIHAKDILVVDYNEMNFLVNNAYDTVYHIDVDSWQTPTYPATAIMESIRDRKVKNRQFTTDSDWFSFGIVAFQLYMGTHPYKGRHPDFSPKDWIEMMNQGISVFNRKCRLPPACQTFDVIPKGHLKWFEGVFEKGERCPPPEPDQVQVIAGPVQAKIISSNDKFNITLHRKYDSNIEAIRFIDGICYAITQTAVMGDQKQFVTFAPETGYVARRTTKDLVAVQGSTPAVVEFNKLEGKLRYKDFAGKEIGVIESDGFFVANRSLYTVVRDSLIEVSFRNTGVKTTAMQQNVANIFHNHQIFDGLVVQSMLGTCRFAIPYEAGKCETVHMGELDKARIVDARYDSGVAIVMAEEGGKYNRYTFLFSKDCKSYTTRVEKDVPLEDINFAIKDNGVCIASNDDKLEIFMDNTKVKVVDSPLNNNEPLIVFKNDTFLVNRDGLYKISSK